MQSVPIKLPPTPPPSDDADSRPLSPSCYSVQHKLNVTTLHLSTRTSKQRPKTSNGRTPVRRRRQSCKAPSFYCLVFNHITLIAKSEHHGDNFFTLHLISRQSGKAAIACVANNVLQTNMHQTLHPSPDCDIDAPSLADLKLTLEGQFFNCAKNVFLIVYYFQANTAFLHLI